MLPGTDVTNMKFKFSTLSSGTIYNKAIKDKTLTITNKIDGNLKEGQSYIVAVTVYYTATYLFSDGTTGTMGKKGTRTPIALVVGKPAGHPYTYAIALKDASGGSKWSTRYDNKNKVSANQVNTAIKQYNGWDNTYNPLFTSNTSIIKGESEYFPTFKYAATYNPGTKLTGKIQNEKWFLGGLGEWELALNTFGVESLINSKDKKDLKYTNPLNYNLVRILFEQAGGDPLSGFFWTADCHGLAHTIVLRPDQLKKEVATKNTNSGATRAFIRFQ